MQADGRVGLIAAADGSLNPLRTNTEGALVTQAGGGKYYEACNNGQIFVAANQTVIALTTKLATTYKGLVVGNAAGTGKNLVMLGFGYFTTVAVPTATAFGIMAGTMTALTSVITPINRKIGGPASIAWVEDDCTIGTPILHQTFGHAWTEATTAGSVGPINWIDLDGSLIIPPGAFAAVYSFIANTAAFQFSFMWQEVDV